MSKELLEKGVDVQDAPEENNYQQYLKLGGIINEKDYKDALVKAQKTTALDEARIRQAENIAKFAGIELHIELHNEDVVDKRIILYGALHNIKPKEVMDSDWRLFREALRMLGDTDALSKLKAACHTNRPLGTYCPLCSQIKYSETCP